MYREGVVNHSRQSITFFFSFPFAIQANSPTRIASTDIHPDPLNPYSIVLAISFGTQMQIW